MEKFNFNINSKKQRLKTHFEIITLFSLTYDL